MLTKEENEQLTSVGPGTPVGALLRRYWHVVGVASQLEADPVRPVRLLGEDLVLFRTEGGELGLIGPRCAHRGLSLAYGVPQAGGLRCAYHGWTYDTEGRLVAMPFEGLGTAAVERPNQPTAEGPSPAPDPAEPPCLPLKVPAYPVRELGGFLFAYLGPPPAPLLPRWDLLVRDDLDRAFWIGHLDCNWLQPMDNAMDPVHFEHLHAAFGNYALKKLGRPPAMTAARHLRIEFDVFEYGIFKRRLLEGEAEDCDDWTVGHPVLFPNILAQGGHAPNLQFRVPTDDNHTIVYWYNTHPRDPGAPPQEHIPLREQPHKLPDGSFVADRVPAQDMLAWDAQGPITDRTTEHLVTSDKGILLYRNVLWEQVERVRRNLDPMGVIRDPAKNEPWIQIPRERRRLEPFRAENDRGMALALSAEWAKGVTPPSTIRAEMSSRRMVKPCSREKRMS